MTDDLKDEEKETEDAPIIPPVGAIVEDDLHHDEFDVFLADTADLEDEDGVAYKVPSTDEDDEEDYPFSGDAE